MITIVALGDSTTAGTPGFFSPRERPPEGLGNIQSQYAYWIQQRHPEWKVLNRGVRGQRTDQILRRFEWDVVQNHPQIVIVLGGANDLHQERSLDFTKTNLGRIYDLAEENKMDVLACSILPLDLLSDEAKEKMKDLNCWIKTEAQKRKHAFCDTFHVLEDPKRSGFLISSPDEIHPDVEGHKRLGEALTPVIEAILAGKSHD